MPRPLKEVKEMTENEIIEYVSRFKQVSKMTVLEMADYINKQRQYEREKYYRNIESRRERSRNYMKAKRESRHQISAN
jgi:alpha-D-ribose 1-methylphosphonate 5-triphosphate diphosphatase PhnM